MRDLTFYPHPNRFKAGFSNVDGEKAVENLPVEGKVPEWLMGSYITNGPAIYDLEGYSFNHWFDGLAMLTVFRFDRNGVSYSSRFLGSGDYRDYERTGTVGSPTFATKGHKRGLERLRMRGEGGDNANVNVAMISGRYYALDESTPMVEFDPQTLGLKREVRDRAPIEGQVTTAHPIFDPKTGETVNYLVHYGARTAYRIFSFNPGADRLRDIATVPVREPSYMHSFTMTMDHVVLTQNPFVASPIGFMTSTRPFYEHFVWKPELRTRFTVVPRDGGEALISEAEAMFCYHHVNSFESGGEIKCDLLGYPDASIVRALLLENLRGPDPEGIQAGQLRRYTIPLAERGEAKYEVLSGEVLEFPRIDPRRILQEHRFVYGAGKSTPDDGEFLDQLVKVDIGDGSVKFWREEGCYPGEAVMVPRPESEGEDDGVVLSLVLDSGRGRSFLVLLDAASFNEIARMDAPPAHPVQVPRGLLSRTIVDRRSHGMRPGGP